MANSSELIKSIDENFYKVIDTPRKLANFSYEIMKSICDEFGVAYPNIAYQYFDPVVLGDYRFKSGNIKLNRYLLQNFEAFKEENSFYYVYQAITNVIHETRHHIQFNSENIEGIHPIIKSMMALTKIKGGPRLIYNEGYSNVPIEVDARHYAFKRISESSILKKYVDSQIFIDDEFENIENPYDYDLLLKNKSKLFKPALEGIRQALSSIKTESKEVDRNLSIYYSIAPAFRREESPLSEYENEQIEEERDDFELAIWGNLTEYLKKRRQKKAKSSNAREEEKEG